MPKKAYDFIFLTIYPLLAFFLALTLKINLFSSLFVYYLIPLLYLIFRLEKGVRKAMVSTLPAGILALIAVFSLVDYTAHQLRIWFIPNSVIPIHLFGVVTMEFFLATVLWTSFLATYYEHFFGKHTPPKLGHPQIKYPRLAYLTIATMAFSLLPLFLRAPYFYTILGIIFIFLIPAGLVLTRYKYLIVSFWGAVTYFFYNNLLYEIAALKLNWWEFPGRVGSEYFGWISVAGVKIPYEEFTFFILLGALAFLTYFEFIYWEAGEVG